MSVSSFQEKLITCPYNVVREREGLERCRQSSQYEERLQQDKVRDCGLKSRKWVEMKGVD